MEDKRPRCFHGVVFPMENCTTCLKWKIEELENALREIRACHDLSYVRGIINRILGN